MAVIAVGDFDPAAIESMIVAHFGPIPALSSRGRARDHGRSPHTETYSLVANREATSTTVNA